MKFYVFLLYITCSVLLIGCKENKIERFSKAQTNEMIFRLPEIPAMLVSPEERAEYLVKHYWDNFEFADPFLTCKQKSIEPIFADFVGVFPHTTYLTACIGINILMKKAKTNAKIYIYFAELAKKYFYDPNSPMHNEEYYIPFMESITESNVLDNTHEIRFKHQLTLALKNRQGSIATDFIYTLASGKCGQLWDIKSEYILLYFNNPDCEECIEMRTRIVASSLFVTLQNQKVNHHKKLTILSVYADEEPENWKKHLSEYPPNWICGYDKKLNIRNNELYDLNSIPTLYLLDIKKKVILKNTSLENVELYLQNK
nr:DUF5106 domain-containing protein [uncultured Bacteroides sp.]